MRVAHLSAGACAQVARAASAGPRRADDEACAAVSLLVDANSCLLEDDALNARATLARRSWGCVFYAPLPTECQPRRGPCAPQHNRSMDTQARAAAPSVMNDQP